MKLKQFTIKQNRHVLTPRHAYPERMSVRRLQTKRVHQWLTWILNLICLSQIRMYAKYEADSI